MLLRTGKTSGCVRTRTWSSAAASLQHCRSMSSGAFFLVIVCVLMLSPGADIRSFRSSSRVCSRQAPGPRPTCRIHVDVPMLVPGMYPSDTSLQQLVTCGVKTK